MKPSKRCVTYDKNKYIYINFVSHVENVMGENSNWRARYARLAVIINSFSYQNRINKGSISSLAPIAAGWSAGSLRYSQRNSPRQMKRYYFKRISNFSRLTETRYAQYNIYIRV